MPPDSRPSANRGGGAAAAAAGASALSAAAVARLIDHTLLKPDAGAEAYAALAREALEHGFCAVCVPPSRLEQIAAELAGSKVRLCTVIGFPNGYSTTASKRAEASEALAQGAHELDMVIDLGRLKDGDWSAITHDIAAVVETAVSHPTPDAAGPPGAVSHPTPDAAGPPGATASAGLHTPAGSLELPPLDPSAGPGHHRPPRGAIVKVIIETALLTDEEKLAACRAAELAGAHFVKTSTGFAGGGATAHDVALMRRAVGDRLGVKASGGLKTLDHARTMLDAGATRLGCSASVQIIEACAR